MHLPPLARKLTLHPTPLSLRRAHEGGKAKVVVLDGDMTFADLWPRFDRPGDGRTLPKPEALRLVRKLLRDGPVPVWRRQAHDARAVGRMHDALCELRLAGVTSKALASSDPVKPLAEFLRTYEEALQANRWLDEADHQRFAVLQVALGRLPASLRAVEQVEVLAGTELLGARLDILRAFASHGVAVRIHMPWDEERPQAFAWTEALLHALETRAHPGMSITFSARHGWGPMQPLMANLYKQRPDAPAPPESLAGPAPKVVVRRAGHGLRHAENVAAQVAAWLTAGVAAQDIAVVAAQNNVAEPVVRALHGAGIGCAHHVQRSLAQSRVARLFLGGLRAHDGLASGAWWVELWETCGAVVHTPAGSWSPGRVVRALRRAGLANTRRWGLWSTDSAPGPWLALPEVCAADILGAMARLCEPLTQLPAEGTLAEMAPALRQWAQALAPPRRISEFVPTPALEAALRGEAEAAAMLRQCILDALQGDAAADDVWTRAEMADWLETQLAATGYSAVARDPQGVPVLRPEDVPGGRFRCLIFAGAEMESFPRPLPSNPFLPEAARMEINRLLGPRLLQYAPMLGRGALPAMARDQWLWLETAASVSEQWVVTLQESPGDGLLTPSELVEELLRVSGVGIAAPADSGCVDGIVPKAWAPALWAVNPSWLPDALSDTLSKRLKSRWRDSVKRPTRATVPSAVAEQIRRYLEDTVHSASRMDALGMCAFRYVAAALWGLAPDDAMALGATPQESGSAAHAALHQVYNALMRQGGLALARKAPQAALVAAQALIAADAADILGETQVHPLLQPALMAQTAATALAQLKSDLGDVSRREPVALEYSFDDRNVTGADALSIQHPKSTRQVRVRGSIDRVDVTDTDVWVLDYKRTVRPRTPGRHFQLALYAAIALRDLRPDARQVHVGWVGLRPAKMHPARDVPDTPEALMTYLRERLFARLDPVSRGAFSPDPDAPATCERCDFRRLCRRDDLPETPVHA